MEINLRDLLDNIKDSPNGEISGVFDKEEFQLCLALKMQAFLVLVKYRLEEAENRENWRHWQEGI